MPPKPGTVKAKPVAPVATPPAKKASTGPNPLLLLSNWTSSLSRNTLAALILGYITLLHLIGLHTFTKGFLLTRVTIPAVTPAYDVTNPPLIPARYDKAVILIIDALRTDFISPYHPIPSSPYHHGILTLPAELTSSDPSRSIIFDSYSDPPTTTMQRLKGITTGSLPTFVDMGANFASTAIEEDSIISQLLAANRTIGFMGDDTWVNLFPNSFALSHPYDSFNVEDLHGVDNGVISHLIPYMQKGNQSQWDVLIGHFLGVDHVGHRVGPERDLMKDKLTQMDEVLREVVGLMDDKTLLVLMGDHGMDSKGNHGGDSELETSAAMWLYTKGEPLISNAKATNTLPKVNQIDIVPTFSILLGLPIPFNNLGSVIPHCFDQNRLEVATRINAEQIHTYIAEYGEEAVEHALSSSWTQAQSASGTQKSTESNRKYTLAALEQLRSLWAQFSVPMIILGLTILGLCIPVLITFYLGIRNASVRWDVFARMAIETIIIAWIPWNIVAVIIGLFYRDLTIGIQTFAIAGAITSEIVLAAPLIVKPSFPTFSSLPIQRWIGPFIVFVHAVSFASNSFIMWEDKMVVFLAATISVVYLIKAWSAPVADMRIRVALLVVAYMVIIRLVGMITICREEQQPFCRVTFYSQSSPTAPVWSLAAILLVGVQFARLIAVFLRRSKSLAGPAYIFLGFAWRGILTLNALYWCLEFLSSYEGIRADRVWSIDLIRLWIGRLSLGGTILVLPYIWATSGLCISIERSQSQTGEEQPVTVLGFANAYGSTYLLFLLIPFALVQTVSQPMAQLALAALLVAILIHLEIVDTQRDAIIMQRSFAQSSSQPGAFEAGNTTTLVKPSFTDVIPFVLIGFIGFFATGHQAVLTSIQWKAAFVGFSEVTYPWSPLLVIINTWGPTLLSALAIPLLAMWNVSPRPSGTIPLIAHTLQLSIAYITYHTALTFASALCSAWLRRHLMVWKVFAPRFMLGGVTLLVVDLGVLVAVMLGLRFTSWKVWRTFKCESI